MLEDLRSITNLKDIIENIQNEYLNVYSELEKIKDIIPDIDDNFIDTVFSELEKNQPNLNKVISLLDYMKEKCEYGDNDFSDMSDLLNQYSEENNLKKSDFSPTL